MPSLVLESRSPQDTLRIGEAFGRLLLEGDVVGIEGDLGAGKTQLVRGLARGLDLAPDVIYSPSFTLVAEHEGRMRLNHIDLFRFEGQLDESEEREIGLDEYLAPSGVTAVEWYKKIDRPRGRWTVEVEIEIGEGDARRMRLETASDRGGEILEGLRKAFRPHG